MADDIGVNDTFSNDLSQSTSRLNDLMRLIRSVNRTISLTERDGEILHTGVISTLDLHDIREYLYQLVDLLD